MSKLNEWEGLVKSIHDSGMEWVEAKLKADQLEEDQRPYLASLMNAIKSDGAKELADSTRKRLAEGNEEYRKYIIGMCLARAAALKAKVKYESWVNMFEARRTEAATERVKIEKGIFERGN
jgi:hypothetical protein